MIKDFLKVHRYTVAYYISYLIVDYLQSFLEF